MDFFHLWLVFCVVMIAASVSPGPAFVMCVRNSLVHGLSAGMLTSLGLGAGLVLHATYAVFGVATLIAQSPIIFNIIKYSGGAYLVYVGIQALWSKGYKMDPVIEDKTSKTNFCAFRDGAMTALLNPKAVLFFVAIFSQFITPEMPLSQKTILAVTAILSDTIWFSIVAIFLTRPAIRDRFLSASKWIERICGAMFIALGIRLSLIKAMS